MLKCVESTLSPARMPRLLALLPILWGLLLDTGVFPGAPSTLWLPPMPTGFVSVCPGS